MGSSIGFEALINQSLDREIEGDIAESLKFAQAALEEAQAAGDNDACALALARMGSVHYRMGHFREMGEYAHLALSKTKGKSRGRADALILLGMHSFETGSLDEAERDFLAAADICRQIDYPQSLCRALHNIAACIYSLRGQFNLALASEEEAYRVACQVNSPHQVGMLINMCNIYVETGRLDKTRQILEKMSQCIAPHSYYDGYYLMLFGKLKQYEENYSQALYYYDQVHTIVEKVGDIPLNVFLCLGKSYCQRMLGNPGCAFEWANNAVEWANRSGDRRMLGRALTERGRVFWLIGNPERAEKDFYQAIDDLNERQQYFDLALAQFFLAAFLHSQQNPKAGEIWQQTMEYIILKDYGCILDRNRELVYPMITAYSNPQNPALAELNARCVSFLQQIDPPPLHIRLLGGFEIIQGGNALDAHLLRKRKTGELLALLLLEESHSLTFDQIADALWQDKDVSSAQMLFHQATSTLRRILEPRLPEKFSSRYLEVAEGSVILKLPPGSTIDFLEFEKCCHEQDWEQALQFYSGDLLPCYLYCCWAVTPRERLKRLFLRALMVMAHRRLNANQYRESIDLCHRALEVDPWQEDAVMLAMRAYVALNDRASAIRVYQTLEKTLKEELQTKPQSSLQELYHSLL